MPIAIASTIGIVLAIVGTVLTLVFITPEKQRPNLNKFFQVVADVFNFKQLLLEKILKCLYIFSTLACICVGFFMLFSGVNYGYFGGFQSFALQGLLTLILGPIIVRLIFESAMLFILVVKNVIDINKKLGGKAIEMPQEPTYTAPSFIQNAVQNTAPNQTDNVPQNAANNDNNVTQ